MAGIIVADTIQSGGSFIRLNSASQTVATINASGIYANTGNLLIAANGTIGVASITNTAITGTMTQAQIGNGVTGTGPAFSVYMGSSQSLSAAIYTTLQLNTKEYDTASCYNTSTYRFTPNVAGYYLLVGSIWFTSAVVPLCQIYKNGAAHKNGLYFFGITGGVFSTSISAIVYLNGTTDYVSFIGRTEGNSTVTNNEGTYFQGSLVRAA
jgi:hypothetical protein